MFKNTVLCGLIVLVIVMAPFAYAGKVELTTYYPAPYGEYKIITTTSDAKLAQSSGSVTVGSATYPATLTTEGNTTLAQALGSVTTVGSASNLTVLVVNNTLTLAPVTGVASAQPSDAAEGSLRYSRNAGEKDDKGKDVGGLLYKDASGWKNIINSGGNIQHGTIGDATASYACGASMGFGIHGYVPTGGSTSPDGVSFPMSFSSTQTVILTVHEGDDCGSVSCRVISTTPTGFTYDCWSVENGGLTRWGAQAIEWIAIAN